MKRQDRSLFFPAVAIQLPESPGYLPHCALLSPGNWGGVFAPNFTELVLAHTHGGVQSIICYVAHDLDAETIEQSDGARQMDIHPSEKQLFLSVLTARMVNNQLPPCTFSTMEYLQCKWWVCTPVTIYPCRPLDPN